MLTQVLTLLKRSVGLTTLAATLSWALLVDALNEEYFLVDKPPHRDKVSSIEGDSSCIVQCPPLTISDQLYFSVIFVSVKFEACYIKGQWGEFRIKKATIFTILAYLFCFFTFISKYNFKQNIQQSETALEIENWLEIVSGTVCVDPKLHAFFISNPFFPLSLMVA